MKALLLHKSVLVSPTTSHLQSKQSRKWLTISAKRRDLNENSSTRQKPIFQLKVGNPILVRSAIAVIGLGFIDAGYSGDWSRIGVISKDSEDLLKLAAFFVVPLCVTLILSVSKEQ